MNHRIASALLVLVSLAGCTSLRAPSRQGLIAMEDHRCVDAIGVMQGPAAQGDGYSVNNLGAIVEAGCPEAGCPPDPVRAFSYYQNAAERGVPIAFSNAGALLEFGKVSGAAQPDAAAALYREGARYGDETSIKGLERLGRPVPPVDRVAPDIAERRQKQLDFALLVAGVMVDRPSPTVQTRPATTRRPVHAVAPESTMSPVTPVTPVMPVARTVVASPVSSLGSGTCRTATDCNTGQICVVPNGQVSGEGVCATPTRGGVAVIATPRLTRVNMVSCQLDAQCPTEFKCERVTPGDLNGLCVGPSQAQMFVH